MVLSFPIQEHGLACSLPDLIMISSRRFNPISVSILLLHVFIFTNNIRFCFVFKNSARFPSDQALGRPHKITTARHPPKGAATLD